MPVKAWYSRICWRILFRPLGVKAGRRLVQNQDFRLHRNNPGDGCPALLPARQFKGALVQQFRRKPGEFRRLVHPLINFFIVKTHILRAEGNILIDRFFKQLVFGVLEDKPHMKPHLADIAPLSPDIPPIQQDFAGGRFQQAV